MDFKHEFAQFFFRLIHSTSRSRITVGYRITNIYL